MSVRVKLPNRERLALPQKETLDQLCFVTGANSLYFSLMTQTIESIRNTDYYKDFPICVLDFGLTDHEKIELYKNYSIHKIAKPSLNFDNAIKLSRPFLPRIFSEFRYFFWIDADAWIHDGFAIDCFLMLAEEQGIGIAKHPTRNKYAATQWGQKRLVGESDTELLWLKTMVNSGVLCLDGAAEVIKNWQNFAIELSQNHEVGVNEPSLMLALYKTEKKYKFLQELHFHATPGQLSIDCDNVLYAGNQFAGFVHILQKKFDKHCVMRAKETDEFIQGIQTFRLI